MNLHDILLIYDYNYWANKRITEASKKITAEKFLAPAPFPHGGLRDTLVHIMDAEYGWRMLLQHNDTSMPDLAAADFLNVTAIQERWKREEL